MAFEMSHDNYKEGWKEVGVVRVRIWMGVLRIKERKFKLCLMSYCIALDK